MTKEEFEVMIGKEIEPEIFDMYNAMYMAAPERIDKFTFVSLLNVDAIPESQASIQRKADRQHLIDAAKLDIANQQNYISLCNSHIKWLRQQISTLTSTEEDVAYARQEIKREKRNIDRARLTISELKFLYNID